MILCGWCGKATPDGARCAACGHVDPRRPWEQRAEPVPCIAAAEGRPPLSADEMRRRLAALGPAATVEALAARWDVDERTIRRWRQKVSG